MEPRKTLVWATVLSLLVSIFYALDQLLALHDPTSLIPTLQILSTTLILFLLFTTGFYAALTCISLGTQRLRKI